MIDDHADHDREFVKKAGPRCREKLRESAAPLRQATAEITAAAADVQAAKREVAENLASVSETIQQSMDEMIATLQQRKQQLLAKASELAEEKLGALDAQEKSLNMSLAEARSLVDVVERSLQNASDEELLEMQQQIASGVEEGCRKRQQVGLQPAAEANIGTDMTFRPASPAISRLCWPGCGRHQQVHGRRSGYEGRGEQASRTDSPPRGLHRSSLQ